MECIRTKEGLRCIGTMKPEQKELMRKPKYSREKGGGYERKNDTVRGIKK